MHKSSVTLVLCFIQRESTDTNRYTDTKRKPIYERLYTREAQYYIVDNGFNVENIGTRPTFQSSRYSTWIDVTLSRNIVGIIKGWRVDDTHNVSDHNVILFSCGHQFCSAEGG